MNQPASVQHLYLSFWFCISLTFTGPWKSLLQTFSPTVSHSLHTDSFHKWANLASHLTTKTKTNNCSPNSEYLLISSKVKYPTRVVYSICSLPAYPNISSTLTTEPNTLG